MAERTLTIRRLSGARPLGALASHFDREGVRFSWFDSALSRPGERRVSVLCPIGGTAFAAGRSARRTSSDGLTESRLRDQFERDRLERTLTHEYPDLFLGGWIGYLAYESQIDFDPSFPDRDVVLPYPRLWFCRAEAGVTVDHDAGQTLLWAWTGDAESLFEEWLTALDRAPDVPPTHPWALAGEPLDPDWHSRSVRQIREHIAAGDAYQVNLTAPAGLHGRGSLLALYQALRSASPGDYCAYFDWPGLAICSSSPEHFFSLRGDLVTARPMKGTRPRGESPQTDAELRAELTQSEKDRAENVMIVDLIRHDLGRVARVGSVEVPTLFEVEEYTTVYQLTSTVTCRLDDGKDVFALLAVMLPPGSMTGAPKVQATRIIRELEPQARGIYSGCLGFIDFRGDATFNVVIRTIVSDRSGARCAVGGGIVWDSDEAVEYREALNKLEGVRRALAL